MLLTGLLLVVIIVITLLITMQYIIEEKVSMKETMLMSVEAGFEKHLFMTYNSAPFFLMVMLYVLFDVEFIVLFPLFMDKNITYSLVINSSILLYVVVITLLLEWMLTGLKWTI